MQITSVVPIIPKRQVVRHLKLADWYLESTASKLRSAQAAGDPASSFNGWDLFIRRDVGEQFYYPARYLEDLPGTDNARMRDRMLRAQSSMEALAGQMLLGGAGPIPDSWIATATRARDEAREGLAYVEGLSED